MQCMYQIAIVEDSMQDVGRFNTYLQRFREEKSAELSCTHFTSAEAFLASYRSQFDIVFMDIRMEGMDGMKAAHRLRERDQTVVLVFLTSLAQYAVQGYEVDALDYILKPLTYPALEMKLTRALGRVKRNEQEILINAGAETIRLLESSLKYIEVFGHNLQYKTTEDTIRGYGTLKDAEKRLPPEGFFRLNNQTIVNLRHVQRINSNTVTVGEREFDISRKWKKDFLEAFHRYCATEVK